MTTFNFIMRSWPPTRPTSPTRGAPGRRLGVAVYQVLQAPSDSSRARKLSPKFAGPYKVIKRVSPVAYQLELTPGTNAHPVFHSSLLKASKPDSTGERTTQVPEAVSVDGQVEYVVDAILDEQVRRGKREYLVHWAGHHTNDSTWEPVANVLRSQALVFYQESSGQGGVL
jgi:Chromo (CHRromatin Organisation MOdifier) domain